eukprot:Phypoly_transcript_11374.p1 GENE.Phypoly_transcript_11374~~Phypoly_transcript_11374.p1  ORF type:complete len:383 (-),score=71.38 Phypoly_transcript_11374:32-1180(-)
MDDIKDLTTTLKNIQQLTLSTSLPLACTHHEDIAELAKQVERKLQELQLATLNLKATEERIKMRNKELEAREKMCKDKERQVIRKEKEAEAKMGKIKEMELKLLENSNKIPNLVNLNVGGHRFTVPKSQLLQHPGSYFHALLFSSYNQELNKEYFIDRDPEIFSLILAFLKSGDPLELARFSLSAIQAEFAFYNIPMPSLPKSSPFDIDKSMDSGEFLTLAAISSLKLWLPKKKFSLMYKASRDGFAASEFHKRCDNRGPTLTLIHSSLGYTFGGYSPLPRDLSGSHFVHPASFIFSLTNPHALPPTKFLLSPGESRVVQCQTTNGPIFGNDICVDSNSHLENSASVFNFPDFYSDTTGKGYLIFTGSRNFITREIEVYAVF